MPTQVIEHMSSAVDLQGPISNHLPGGSAPNKLHMWDNGSGPNDLTPYSGWNMSPYTYSGHPPTSTYQAKSVPDVPGTTGCSIGDGILSFWQNGFETKLVQNQFYNSMSFGDEPRNQVFNWEGTKDFHFRYRQTFGYFYSGLPDYCAYSYITLIIYDKSINRSITLMINDWDSRPGRIVGEYTGFAPIYNPDGSLAYLMPYAGADLGHSTFVDNYGDSKSTGDLNSQARIRVGTITQQNLRNLITAYRQMGSDKIPEYQAKAAAELAAHNGQPTTAYYAYLAVVEELNDIANMSLDVSNYKVTNIGIQPEHAVDSATFRSLPMGQFGMTYNEVMFCTWVN
ncbi:hypothetical protein ABIE32_002220 [Comamonas sp. 4034]